MFATDLKESRKDSHLTTKTSVCVYRKINWKNLIPLTLQFFEHKMIGKRVRIAKSKGAFGKDAVDDKGDQATKNRQNGAHLRLDKATARDNVRLYAR